MRAHLVPGRCMTYRRHQKVKHKIPGLEDSMVFKKKNQNFNLSILN